MNMVSDKTFRALAEEPCNAEAAEELNGIQIRRRIGLLRGVAEESRVSSHPDAELTSSAYKTLLELEAADPAAVSRILRHPTVGAWAWRTFRSVREGGHERPGRLGSIALAAAIVSGAACRVKVLMDADGGLMLPGLGRLSRVGSSDEIKVDGTYLLAGDWSAEVDLTADKPGWQVLHRIPIDDGFSVTLDDLDPYRWPEPGRVTARLAPEALPAWRSLLPEAWRILRANHSGVAEEIAIIVRALTPIAAPPEGVSSASARETFGTIAMSTPTGAPAWLAETFAHEIQHAKLDALMHLVPLVRYERTEAYYAPWRPDPRPAHGLLQGAYAYLGVTEFWRRQHVYEGLRGRIELARWREGVRLVLDTLEAEHLLTNAGLTFVDGMRTRLGAVLAEPLDDESLAAAEEAAAGHRAVWEARHGSSNR
ncbi:HEXXH motif domain-containing protein [Herbidospora sp. NEAU-GS84]|uniref:HEXXH motif domain-containing protein n=1 Tax=Herbidospora solisilvae TaxID=2696284 RepID=A0A7C9JFK0_9ACTN|nr:HEXXH motif domain-containing protein [Herbidospora solisilvae]NAS25441.1 HEXXH motif domain-containing protein [Herbidospora solisilvae]